MKYRLLDDAEMLEPTDEALLDNCVEWEAIKDSGRWFVGCKYNRNFFVPMRRPLDETQSPNAKLSDSASTTQDSNRSPKI